VSQRNAYSLIPTSWYLHIGRDSSVCVTGIVCFACLNDYLVLYFGWQCCDVDTSADFKCYISVPHISICFVSIKILTRDLNVTHIKRNRL
jgi:hypothetical protein